MAIKIKKKSKNSVEKGNDALREIIAKGYHLLKAGNLQESRELAKQVIAAYPEDAATNFFVAKSLQHNGEYKDALEFGKRALNYDPENAQYYIFVGEYFMSERKFAEAHELYKKATELDPNLSNGFCGLSRSYLRLNNQDGAREAARRAIELRADRPIPYHTLFYIYEIANDYESIEVLLSKAKENLTDRPYYLEAKLLHKKGKIEEACDLLEEYLKSPSPNLSPSSAHVKLAKYLDELGKYNEAYEHFSTGQKLALKERAPKTTEFDFFDSAQRGCREWFVKGRVDDWKKEFDDGVAPPVFVVGFPRSGTTLTNQILGSHENIEVIEEVGILNRMIFELAKYLGRPCDYPQLLAEVDEDIIRRAREQYVAAAKNFLVQGGSEVEGKIIVDKLPLNIQHLGLIYRLFPEAKVVVILRDPRDVCLSCFMQDFEYNAAMKHFYSLENTAKTYADIMDLYFQYRDVLPLQMLEYRYEDMVDDPETATRKLLDFIGEEWSEDILRYHEGDKQRKNVHTPSFEAIRKPIYKTAKGRWHNYEKQFAPYQETLAPYVKEFGYEPA